MKKPSINDHLRLIDRCMTGYMEQENKNPVSGEKAFIMHMFIVMSVSEAYRERLKNGVFAVLFVVFGCLSSFSIYINGLNYFIDYLNLLTASLNILFFINTIKDIYKTTQFIKMQSKHINELFTELKEVKK